MKSPILASLLFLAAFSGCFGMADDGGDDAGFTGFDEDGGDGDSMHGDGNETGGNGTGGNGTSGNGTGNETGNYTGDGNFTGNGTDGNGTDNGTANQTHEWKYENRTGTVSGLSIIVSTPSEEETWTIENGTLHMFVNVTVEGDDLELVLVPPDCNDASCEQSASSGDGPASFEAMPPEEGEWKLVLTAEDIGSVSSDYTIEIATLVPAAPPPMNGTEDGSP